MAQPSTPPQGPARFYNRELSWLQFNRRVLEEAQNQRHPLLERLRFLSISASNLDEFYMVRVGRHLRPGRRRRARRCRQDGLTPAQQLDRDQPLRRRPRQPTSRPAGATLKAEMADGRHPHRRAQGADARPSASWLERQFLTHIFPILTPIAVDPAHPFPFIQNKGLTVGVEMRRERDGKTMHALIADSRPARALHPPAAAEAPEAPSEHPLHPHRDR